MDGRIVVIDGQGGRIGKLLVEGMKARWPEAHVTAIGTNSIATANMLKAGADAAATGENAVIVASRTADVIVGPLGIVVADSLLGEITPPMAAAVGQSRAVRVLLPMSRCDNIVVGAEELPVGELVRRALEAVGEAARCSR